MTCTSGFSASVERINCEKGAKSSTTRTRTDDMLSPKPVIETDLLVESDYWQLCQTKPG